MKKYLRNKRYLKSRRSVMIGRSNKQLRKIDRMIYLVGKIDWKVVTENIIEALKEMVRAAEELERRKYGANTS
jgi:hypothetical protein